MSGSSNILRLEFHLCYLNDALEKILVVVLFNSFTSSMDCPPVTISSMLYFLYMVGLLRLQAIQVVLYDSPKQGECPWCISAGNPCS